MTLRNRWRLWRGKPCLWLSVEDLSRLSERYAERTRAEGERLAALVAFARAEGLPMPFEPTTVVGGMIISPSQRLR